MLKNFVIFSRHSQIFDSYVSQIQFNALTVFYIITLNQTLNQTKSVLYTRTSVQVWLLRSKSAQTVGTVKQTVSVNQYGKTVNK